MYMYVYMNTYTFPITTNKYSTRGSSRHERDTIQENKEKQKKKEKKKKKKKKKK